MNETAAMNISIKPNIIIICGIDRKLGAFLDSTSLYLCKKCQYNMCYNLLFITTDGMAFVTILGSTFSVVFLELRFFSAFLLYSCINPVINF